MIILKVWSVIQHFLYSRMKILIQISLHVKPMRLFHFSQGQEV